MAEVHNGLFLDPAGRINRSTPPVLLATLGVAAAVTLFDVLAVVSGLFRFGFAALELLNLAAFLLNLLLLHLSIVFSGGRPPERRLAAAGFLVWRTYLLAKRAVFLTGAIAILLEVAPPHLEPIEFY